MSETDLRDVETRTVWGYYYYPCPSCGAHMYGYGKSCCVKWLGGCGGNIPNSFVIVWSPTSWDSVNFTYVDAGGGKYYTTIDGERVFKWTDGGSKTQYQYRTRSTQQVANYGNWSTWGDTAYSNSSNRQVEIRTVYRYCDRSRVATYHFYRWGSWSNWSETQTTATNDQQVENATYYRYRDPIKTTTYFFRRWTDWSTYSDTAATPSENAEVRTITRYRYKSKAT